jgi:hypothetical protein
MRVTVRRPVEYAVNVCRLPHCGCDNASVIVPRFNRGMTGADSWDPLAAVRAMANELTETIVMARALVSSGRRVDLTGFDRQVGLLCAKALDLPPDAGRRLRPDLIVLSGALETLSRVLAAQAAPSG